MKKYLLIVLCFGIWNCEEGADGLSGENGQDGVDGENGLSTILYTLDEPSGDNCANGGTKVVYGIDVNSDGVLSDSEIDNSAYICNGTNGQDGTDGQDGEVEIEEQHPIVGIWFQGDTTISTNEYFDGTTNTYVSIIDTSIYDTTGGWGSTRSRLIFTEEKYFNWGWNSSLFNQLDVFSDNIEDGNYILVDNIIWLDGKEYMFELYSSNSRLRIWLTESETQFSPKYFFEKQ